MLVTEVAGRSIFVVRNRDGELRAFYNTCRHRGTRLLTPDERRVKRFIRCPYHSWAYDLDGNVHRHAAVRGLGRSRRTSRPPSTCRTCAAFDRADYGLLRVAVDELGPARVREPRRGRRRRCPSSSATCPRGPPATASTSGSSPASPSTTSRPTTSWSPRTSWSTTTCPGSIRGWSRSPRSTPTTAGRAPACTRASARRRSRRTPSDGGWEQRPRRRSAGLDDVRRRQRALHLAVPQRRGQHPAEPRLRHPRAHPPSPRSHARDDLPAHASRVDRAGRRPSEAVEQLASFWDSVNREDIAIVERVQQGLDTTAVPGRPPLLPVRGVAAPLPEHGRRPHGRRAAGPARATRSRPRRCSAARRPPFRAPSREEERGWSKQSRRIDVPVFAIAAAISVAFVLVGVLFKDEMATVVGDVLSWLLDEPRLAVRALDGGIPDLRRVPGGDAVRPAAARAGRRSARVQDDLLDRDDVQRRDGHRADVLRRRRADLASRRAAARRSRSRTPRRPRPRRWSGRTSTGRCTRGRSTPSSGSRWASSASARACRT